MGHHRGFMYFSGCDNKKSRRDAEIAVGRTVVEWSDWAERGWGVGESFSDKYLRREANVAWMDKLEVFDCVEDAQEWLDEHVGGCECKAVRYRAAGTYGDSARTEKLRKALPLANEQVDELMRVLDVRDRKSDSITCGNCRSRITLAYYRSGVDRRGGQPCPVCGNNLLSKTARDRLFAARAKYAETYEKLKDAQREDKVRAAKKAGCVKWALMLDVHC